MKVVEKVVSKIKKELEKIAKESGYKEIKGEYSHGQKIFYDSKNKKYISIDADSHNGGTWKMADSIKNLKTKQGRLGTYDENFNRIGD